MIKNKIFGTRPVMAHAPGRLQFIPLWGDFVQFSKQYRFKTRLPDDLSITTFNNGSSHNDKVAGLLESALDQLGVPYKVLGQGVGQWQNSLKIPLLAASLDSTVTKYVLVSDSSDVFVINKLDDMCERFECFGCDAVFNVEKLMWPVETPQSLIDFENSISTDLYLNAGLWMARTEFARELLQHCLFLQDRIQSRSEQFYYKHCYQKFYPRMKGDYECKMFQGLNRVGYDEIEMAKVF